MAIKLGGGGGVTVPIGSQLSLYDTAETVVKGNETFLRNGVSKTASDFPNAVVRNYVNNGDVTGGQFSFASSASPWAGATSPVPQLGGAASQTEYLNTANITAAADKLLYVVMTNGYVSQFSNWGTVFIRNRYLIDGVVFRAGTTNIRPITTGGQSIIRSGNNLTAGDVMFGGRYGSGYDIVTMSPDLQTVRGRWTCVSSSFSNMGKAQAITWQGHVYIIHPNGSAITVKQFTLPNASQVSAGTGDLVQAYTSNIAYPSQVGYYLSTGEIVPYYSHSTRMGATQGKFFGVRATPNGFAANRIWYYSVNNGTTGYSDWTAYDVTNLGDNTNSFRAPFVTQNNELQYISTSNATPQTRNHSSAAAANFLFPTSYSATGYAGYAYRSSTIAYIGITGENKIIQVNPHTGIASTTSISTASQAVPYRIAWHSDVLYNLNGTNIHTYNTTSGAFIQSFNISGQVTGTNAVGIAHDGTNLFVLDGSNSKVHKYNSTGATYIDFVTLSDNPHTLTGTLSCLAADNNFFYVVRNSSVYVYLSTGAYGGAFASIGDCVDIDFHDNNIAGILNSSSRPHKKPALNIVGNPSGTQGTTTTTYIRVN